MTTEPQNTVAADTAPEKETIEPSLMGIFAKARFHQIVKDLAGQTNLGHLFGLGEAGDHNTEIRPAPDMGGGRKKPVHPLSAMDRRPDTRLQPLVLHGLTIANLDEALKAIATGKRLIVVFKHALPKEQCTSAAEKAILDTRREVYSVAPDVGRIGMSLYETQFSEAAKQVYWARAQQDREAVRQLFGANGCPIDTIRAMCEELPSFAGAELLTIENQKAFIGLVRILTGGGDILPHIDGPGWDVPDALACHLIDNNVAGNFYLRMPKEGGAITVYDHRFGKLEMDANRRPEPHEYAIADEALPGRKVTYRPETGDLVFFSASMPHAVSAVSDDAARVTLSFFVGIGQDRILRLFS
tara:strand:- start:141 stop:1208 length:1068 start_codon:yes stop_codon:yes gene_type:complete